MASGRSRHPNQRREALALARGGCQGILSSNVPFAFRAADVLDILVQPRRNAKSARRFLKKLIRRSGRPRVAIKDKLRSHVKPIRDEAPDADQRAHKGLNNRIEGAHRPTRRREKIPLIVCKQTTAGQRIDRFKPARQAQRFLAAHDQISILFHPRRYRLTAASYRHARSDAYDLWNEYALEMTA